MTGPETGDTAAPAGGMPVDLRVMTVCADCRFKPEGFFCLMCLGLKKVQSPPLAEGEIERLASLFGSVAARGEAGPVIKEWAQRMHSALISVFGAATPGQQRDAEEFLARFAMAVRSSAVAEAINAVTWVDGFDRRMVTLKMETGESLPIQAAIIGQLLANDALLAPKAAPERGDKP